MSDPVTLSPYANPVLSSEPEEASMCHAAGPAPAPAANAPVQTPVGPGAEGLVSQFTENGGPTLAPNSADREGDKACFHASVTAGIACAGAAIARGPLVAQLLTGAGCGAALGNVVFQCFDR